LVNRVATINQSILGLQDDRRVDKDVFKHNGAAQLAEYIKERTVLDAKIKDYEEGRLRPYQNWTAYDKPAQPSGVNPTDQAAEDQAAEDQAAKEQAAKEQAAKEQAAKEQAAKDQKGDKTKQGDKPADNGSLNLSSVNGALLEGNAKMVDTVTRASYTETIKQAGALQTKLTGELDSVQGNLNTNKGKIVLLLDAYNKKGTLTGMAADMAVYTYSKGQDEHSAVLSSEFDRIAGNSASLADKLKQWVNSAGGFINTMTNAKSKELLNILISSYNTQVDNYITALNSANTALTNSLGTFSAWKKTPIINLGRSIPEKLSINNSGKRNGGTKKTVAVSAGTEKKAETKGLTKPLAKNYKNYRDFLIDMKKYIADGGK
jgi:hypothetical protein